MSERHKSRVLGIDYGERRVGLALSDPMGLIARGLPTIANKSLPEILESLENILQEHEVGVIVVGLPLTMRGEVSEMARKAEQFMQALRVEFDIPVQSWDERLTTALAHRTAKDYGKSPSRNKTAIDEISAILILQSYLDHQQSTVSKLHK